MACGQVRPDGTNLDTFGSVKGTRVAPDGREGGKRGGNILFLRPPPPLLQWVSTTSTGEGREESPVVSSSSLV